jgi:multisubunit Na+/H+ antiporter MnhB subunit
MTPDASPSEKPLNVPEVAPWAPPDDYRFETELLASAPRPIPREVRSGSFCANRRRWRRFLLGMAVALLVLVCLPFVQNMSWYVLPLQYLHWGAGIAFFCWFIVGIVHLVDAGRVRYLTHGIALVGRIAAISSAPTGLESLTQNLPSNETPGASDAPDASEGTFVGPWTSVVVESFDPKFQRPQRTTIPLNEFLSTFEMGGMTLRARPGDWITLLAIPPGIQRSIRPYGLLGLHPDANLFSHKGRPWQPRWRPWVWILGLCAGLLGIAGIFCLINFFGRYFAVGGNEDLLGWSAGIGALAGIVFMVFTWKRWESLRRETRLAVLIPPILGALGTVIVLNLLNFTLDRTTSLYQPVRVEKFWHTTHNFVVRTYDLEASPVPSGESRKYSAFATELGQLTGREFAVLELGQGAFGMHWIRRIHPLSIRPLLPLSIPDKDSVRLRSTAGRDFDALVTIETSDRQRISLPPEVEKALRETTINDAFFDRNSSLAR